jgi:hypothetical protein
MACAIERHNLVYPVVEEAVNAGRANSGRLGM